MTISEGVQAVQLAIADIPLIQVLLTLAFLHLIWLVGRSLLGNKGNKDSTNSVKLPNKRKRSRSQSFESGSGESSSTADDEETRAKKAEIIRLTEQILQAKSDCDFDAYCKLVSTDMSCFEPETHGNLVKGVDFHKFFFENNSTKRGKASNTTMLNPHVTLLGEDGACIAYVNLTQNVMSNNQVAVKQVEETRVWHRSNGSWRMVHFHRSERPERTSNSAS